MASFPPSGRRRVRTRGPKPGNCSIECWRRLPEQDQQLLVLKEMEGFSVQELAEILDLNVNTVKVRLFRARGRIMDVYRRRSRCPTQICRGGGTEERLGKCQRTRVGKNACVKYEALLEDYLDGALDATEAEAAEEHLQSCEPCRAALDRLPRVCACSCSGSLGRRRDRRLRER